MENTVTLNQAIETGARANALQFLTTANSRGSTMASVTKARACEYFNYEPETGQLIFRKRKQEEFTPGRFSSHLKMVGKPAGAVVGGYVKVCIDGNYFLAHKVAWLIHTGEWVEFPEFEIDHINGDGTDNRWENLRKVTKSQNQRNSGQRLNNTSGVHGVNWKPRGAGRGSWVARIWNGPKHVYLGCFDDIHEAAIARRAAERALGYTGTDRPPPKEAYDRAVARSKAERGKE